ncbi:uncharacterized protein MONOS_9224 [Monocercomonoides exilis]|uniref:uncharacterized protein n=1 Tax=Monocercomonoides exilis TaxID=2049356 RepID=UPI0035598F7C|nr:hypothetical protein MONOS_9224 [Monocercomonoides exilis]|eukprot:MONOS_9224.1-p1 / transcript=MONOS_9224.1 / gene=MONOS_9224 / organism=Monocercomonoides_exilis_PA203 / gene_product=unspecified product / transcript_product=unspecified product / location=Mono_scaffold00372:52560-52971(-) / protein_length=104 / sequence_SO=supercontig / SO=protein_coding / is_pseudo=false
MAFLALSCIDEIYILDKELYLNEITENIKYHQKCHNLTRLAYQSVWQFLMYRFINDKSLEEVFVNELHFAREAIKELEELAKCEKQKKKEKKPKETKIEVSIA